MALSSIALPRLSQVQCSVADFFTIANLGDTNSAYRGKPIWTNYQVDELCLPVEKLLIDVPAARNAVLYFISNLIHENVHLYLLEQEKKKDASKKDGAEYSNLQKAVFRLLTTLDNFRLKTDPKSAFSLTLLNMLFELLSDLYRLNSHRPSFNHQKPSPQLFLRTFQLIPFISKLYVLLDSTFDTMLKASPDKAVFTFMSAHKIFFNNFDWVAIHIAETFPNIATQVVKVGAEEFCAHCNDLLNPAVRSNPSRVLQLQEEYNGRLRLFTELFVYMEKNRKVELRNCFFSIIELFLRNGENWRELLFFVKLSLFSSSVVLPFIDEILPRIIADPSLIDRLHELSENPALSIAVSPTVFLHNFFRKIIEKINNELLFDLLTIISSFI